MKLSTKSAHEILKQINSTPRMAKYRDGECLIFEINEDMKMGDVDRFGFEAFLWKGDRIVFPPSANLENQNVAQPRRPSP